MTPPGFLAEPATGTGPGVLVLHAWWGLNDTMKDHCTRLAEAGFVAFAPDLYHGAIATTIPEAEALGLALDAEHVRARAEIAEAAKFLEARAEATPGRLAVVAFSLGAYYALDLAAAEPARVRSVVLYYGTGSGDYSRSRAAYLGHFAENDVYEPNENVEALAKLLARAGRAHTFHRYPGTGHWFAEPDRTDAFDAGAARLAWDRTLEFLRNQGG